MNPKNKPKHSKQASNTPKPRPQWDSHQKDDSEYKLSKIELVQRKVALLSKNREAAQEQWRSTQQKLKDGIIDDDTISIH